MLPSSSCQLACAPTGCALGQLANLKSGLAHISFVLKYLVKPPTPAMLLEAICSLGLSLEPAMN